MKKRLKIELGHLRNELEHLCWVLHMDKLASWLAGEDHTYDVVGS